MYFISVILIFFFFFFFYISHFREYAECSPMQLMHFYILILCDLNFHILHILVV